MASHDAHSVRKSKANTACNTCRARKTRCDGERPSCSYCRTTGGQCVYRTTAAPDHPPPLIEQTILERLDNVEARLRAVSHLGETWARSRQSPIVVEPALASLAHDRNRYVQTPSFHTAASHKMLHYWPRIHMSITLHGLNPLRYVEDTESGGVPHLPALDGPADVDAAAVERYLARMQENGTGLDLLLAQLLQRHANVASTLLLPQASPPSDTPASAASHAGGDGRRLALDRCSCQLLLAIALAARTAYQKSCLAVADAVARDTMEQAFRLAFARIGEIFFAADDESTLFLILGAHLLMSEAYPIAALRLIQAAGDRLGRCGKRQVNEPWWIERFQDCLKLHHVIESDILLTTDGLPSDAAFSLMNGLPAMRSLREAETGYSNLSVAEIARKKFGETLLEDVLALATLQNRILAQMYTIEQAYSQPSVLARSVTELKAELTHWFDDLPLEWHFPRDLSGAMTIPTPEPDMLAHLRLKYYVLEFLMCRPILYYIAHESFEARLDHASVSTDGSTESEGRPFWVYDACHRCLQCAALMILGSDTRWPPQEHAAPRKDWFELHMIWGAALTLALALATPALTRFLPKHGQAMDASMLLAKAEAILLRAAEANCVPAQCLAILCDVEQHLLGGTPG